MMPKNKKAQVGVGTLIIFITTILVAAIGASVIIQTSGSLQQQATVTGEQAIKEISTKIKVQSVIGYSTSTSRIDKLILVVELSSGSNDVKLSDIVLTYQSKDIYITGIKYNLSASDNNSYPDFYKNVIKGDGDDILEYGEIIELHFWIEDATSHPLAPNTEFTLILMPKSGTSSLIRTTTPSVFKYSYVSLA
ncbi:MAG: hypothetical protein DRN88_05065 [Candidatus Hydrothermarchaeota archaeon]|nr:MAG: hypothetical protein DRN88_05065 [Candidatus Hydrothermarchaeota archaeon]